MPQISGVCETCFIFNWIKGFIILLFSRCLKSEGECEMLQKKTVDLRRKLDDTTAALQEIGRENQSLQVK